MSTGSKSDARFASSVLPWLLGGGALLLYACTLDSQVSLESLHSIAQLTGITWLAELSAPVTFLVTYPIRWLRPSAIPIAINFFTACCATLTLVLLVRSVALLPHDRTPSERQRNPDRHGFLNNRHAWLVPVLATLACGLQITFWENAVAATGEMINLLIFACMVWCVLEFRASERESWLYWLALLIGLGMANDWAITAFAPGFLIAVLWIKGFFNFFNPRYVDDFLKNKTGMLSTRLPLRMVACWLTGASLFFLMPLVATHSKANPLNFWTGVQFDFRNYQILLGLLPFRIVALLGCTSVVPLLFMGIRWGRLIQNSQPGAANLIRMLFHIIHAFFLGICLWTILGSVFSPRHLLPVFACLPLYFLVALNVGYYSGYFLGVFGPRIDKSWHREHPQGKSLQMTVVSALALLTMLTPAALAHRNLPEILRRKHDTLVDYYKALDKSLPGKGAVILSEDSSRVQFIQARLIESGRQSDYLVVDAGLLARYPRYFQFLDAQNPQFKISDGLTNQLSQITNSSVLIQWVANIVRNHELYFMNPFAGSLAEIYYPEPHGLFLRLQPYATNAMSAPLPSSQLISKNQEFWRMLQAKRFSEVVRRIQLPDSSFGETSWQRFFKKAHLQPDIDRHAQLAGEYYSIMLDNWAVTLQQFGSLEEAGKWFEQARDLAPQNMSVQINTQCNHDLQLHKTLNVDASEKANEKFGRGRDWDLTLRQEGPIDDPSACLSFGQIFTAAHMYRQAAWQFQRSQILAPNSTNAPAKLAELFLRTGQYTNALAAAEYVLRLAPEASQALVLKGLVLVELGKFTQAIPPLTQALDEQPANVAARLARGVAYLRLDKFMPAKEDYEAALHAQPVAYPAYYGLAEIAFRTQNTPEAIRNCESFLSNAPPASPEMPQVKAWLGKLKAAPISEK